MSFLLQWFTHGPEPNVREGPSFLRSLVYRQSSIFPVVRTLWYQLSHRLHFHIQDMWHSLPLHLLEKPHVVQIYSIWKPFSGPLSTWVPVEICWHIQAVTGSSMLAYLSHLYCTIYLNAKSHSLHVFCIQKTCIVYSFEFTLLLPCFTVTPCFHWLISGTRQ